MATQKEIKSRYMDIICNEVWVGNESMQKYAEKQFYVGVELANEDLYVIDKPSIQKDFCFGYGMYGCDWNNDYDRAAKVANHARTNEDYFIQENLSEFNRKIEILKDSRYVAYKYIAYTGQESGSKLKAYTTCHSWEDPEEEPWKWSNLKDVELMTEDEINAIVNGYEQAKTMFTKRLNTYLKRYGLSKLNVWTYLRD